MTTYYVDSAGNDANAGTSAGSGNSWLTLQKAFDTAVAGDLVYIKSDKTYSEQVDIDTNSGSVTSRIKFVGYTTTIGDGGRVTWDGTTYCAQTTGMDYLTFQNIIFTGATSYCIDCITNSSVGWKFYNCHFTNSASTYGRSAGYNYPTNWSFVRCKISGMSSHGIGNSIGTYCCIHDCLIIDNGGHGISGNAYFGYFGAITGNIIAGNTSDGINIPNVCLCSVIRDNTIQGNGGDGIDIHGTGNQNIIIENNIITDHSGAGDVGVRLGTLSGNSVIAAYRNFYYNNTTHNSGGDAAGDFDVTLSADPFTNAASDNWTLNNTAGGGADVRAAAGPTFDATNIGYRDGGALQHQDSGGGGGLAYPVGRAI